MTLALVVCNALQGILSSFFFKYADTILKKYRCFAPRNFSDLSTRTAETHESGDVHGDVQTMAVGVQVMLQIIWTTVQLQAPRFL